MPGVWPSHGCTGMQGQGQNSACQQVQARSRGQGAEVTGQQAGACAKCTRGRRPHGDGGTRAGGASGQPGAQGPGGNDGARGSRPRDSAEPEQGGTAGRTE
eukprot:15448246-Alexandrium_andersonii.AAC.1